jgi:hypothetical protein
MLKILEDFPDQWKERIVLVIREEQRGLYRDVHLPKWEIPTGSVTYLGTTSQWIRDTALGLGLSTIIESDDDICQLNICYFDFDGSGTYKFTYEQEEGTPKRGVDLVRPNVERRGFG